MLKKSGLAIVGATLLFGAASFTASAPAFAMVPTSHTAPAPIAVTDNNMTHLAQLNDRRERRQMRREWRRDRDGIRCSRRSDRCRHFHRGAYYEVPWWTLPLIIGGGIVAGSRYNDNYGSRHVEWCLNRYRSYNPRNNTWVSYSGEVRQCNSPY